MVESIRVRNFKSIKDISLECGKINVFIGEPNTGKSNILEVLGFLSSLKHGSLRNFVRLNKVTELFYDFNIYEDIEIDYGDLKLTASMNGRLIVNLIEEGNKNQVASLGIDTGSYVLNRPELFERIRFYRFKIPDKYEINKVDYLTPPFGSNLPSIIQTRQEIKEFVADLFGNFNYKMSIDKLGSEIALVVDTPSILTLIPYNLVSDTLQRMVFYVCVLLSNRDAVIVLNEPETNVFPYYTKTLAEMIALDDQGNQYFVSTHNPYFLLSIIEKVKKEDLRVFITYVENNVTQVKALGEEEIEEIMEHGVDPFFNLSRYIEDQ